MVRILFDIKSLTYYISVRYSGSMTLSSKQLNVPVATISAGIRRLENFLCFPLLLRTHQGMLPAVGTDSILISCLLLLSAMVRIEKNDKLYEPINFDDVEEEVEILMDSPQKLTIFLEKIYLLKLSPQLIFRFLVVYQQRSINRAAEQLSISQPQLSRQLGSIEKILNIKLFNRQTWGLECLVNADIFYADAIKLNEITEQILTQGNEQFVRDTQTTKIGSVPPYSSRSSLSELICHMCHEWPNKSSKNIISIDVSTANDLVTKLKNNELDMAIVDSPHIVESFSERIISHSPIVLVGKRLDIKSNLNLISKDQLKYVLENKPFVLPFRNTGIRGLIDKWFIANNLAPKSVIEVESVSIAVALIRNSGFFSFLPHCPSFDSEEFYVNRIPKAPISTLRMVWNQEKSASKPILDLHKIIDEYGTVDKNIA